MTCTETTHDRTLHVGRCCRGIGDSAAAVPPAPPPVALQRADNRHSRRALANLRAFLSRTDLALPAGLAEREYEGLDAGLGEDDLERSVGDRSALTDQLVQPLLIDRALALLR